MTSLIDVIYPKGNHSQIQNQNEIEFSFCINKNGKGFIQGRDTRLEAFNLKFTCITREKLETKNRKYTTIILGIQNSGSKDFFHFKTG